MPSFSDLAPSSETDTPAAAPSPVRTFLDHARDEVSGAGAAIGDVALHPGRAVMNAINAPGRASKSLIAGHGLSARGGANDDTNRADIRRRLGYDADYNDPYLFGIHSDYTKLPDPVFHAAQGVMDFAQDVDTDPLSLFGGALAKLVGRGAKASHIGDAAAKIPGASKVAGVAGKLFDPHHATAEFTEHGQNLIDRTTNVHGQAAARAKVADDRLIAQHQAAIRAGERPEPIRALLEKHGLTNAGGLFGSTDSAEVAAAKTPAALRELVDNARGTATRANIKRDLEKQGLLGGGTGETRQIFDKTVGHDAYFRDPAKADAARESLAKSLAPDTDGFASTTVGKIIGGTNEKLKAAFLALPGAHMANLANLAYNSHGASTAVHGLLRAIPIALGKEGARSKALTDTLEEAGAHNQYAPLYQEANKFAPMRAGARALNALQDKTLNAYESGLRAAMLEKDLRAGMSVEDSVRRIHRALGSDPSSELTKGLGMLPASQFPRFHTQTAIGSTLRALREQPGRITTAEHALGMTPDSDDDEPTATGDPVYHLSTPTAAFLRMMDNPYKYFLSTATLGKIAGISDTNTLAGSLIKGNGTKAGEMLMKAVLGAIPGSELGKSVYDFATGEPGQSGESGEQDAGAALFGGYYATK